MKRKRRSNVRLYSNISFLFKFHLQCDNTIKDPPPINVQKPHKIAQFSGKKIYVINELLVTAHNDVKMTFFAITQAEFSAILGTFPLIS